MSKLPRRTFLHLAAGAAVLPAVSRIARVQAYPSRPVRFVRLCRGGCGRYLHPVVRALAVGVEPAWTLLKFESLRALRQEPSAVQTAIRIANDLSADEIAGSITAVARRRNDGGN